MLLSVASSLLCLLYHQSRTNALIQTCREGVEEDSEEEEEEEEDDKQDDEPLEAPPQDELECLIGGGEPQKRGLWTSGRSEEVSVRNYLYCYCLCVYFRAEPTEAPPDEGSCWVRPCRDRPVSPHSLAPSQSLETSPPFPETQTFSVM